MLTRRTDLAVEAEELWRESAGETTELRGVRARERAVNGFQVTTVDILDGEGAAALGKPVGSYTTVEIDKLLHREDDAFTVGARVLADELSALLDLRPEETVLVAGLGNRAITADAVGPATVGSTMVTSHLVERMPDMFGSLRRVVALETGVLGTTGIESAEVIRAITDRVKPDRVIVVDALAARRLARVCRTVQLADTGIVPGSGVGNARAAINRETLGIPVIAVGVPTVVDAATLAADIAAETGASAELLTDEFLGAGMVVTPKDIDANVADIAKLVAYGINLALHPELTIDDVTMFVS
ncbi:MAG: GPR endopeptidase [Oscillospiraceae bacterium]|jgi:spore protease|nr:GPR endopeptidase [Oscillospiraceae bacterium]